MKSTITLKKKFEFLRTYKRGRFYVGTYLTLYVLPNKFETNRIGVSISKRVGKSVKRNRIRRLVKECFRFYNQFLKEGFDCIFVSRSTSSVPDYNDIYKEMKYLLKRLNLIDQEKWNCQKDF